MENPLSYFIDTFDYFYFKTLLRLLWQKTVRILTTLNVI